MPIGDGIRRNAATVSKPELDRLRQAFVALDTTKLFPDGVTYWDKQEEIHKSGHAGGSDVHSGPAFIPWHRELVNRLEGLIREYDSELSLHYWDWTTDPTPLFTADFMGGKGNPAGPPFENFESSEGGGQTKIWRSVQAGAPPLASDNAILHASDTFSRPAQYAQFQIAIQNAHNAAHGYIGGTIGQQHFSFHDPFVFLLHSNMDRLFAEWQTQPGETWRMDPNQVYGSQATSGSLLDNIEPWSGGQLLRPWAAPENQQKIKRYNDLSVIAPPCYDTLASVFAILEVENPSGVINFNDVPEGETAARAAVFHAYFCDDVTLEIKTAPNAPYTVLFPTGSTTLHHHPRPYEEVRFWFGFTGTNAGSVAPSGSVTIRCVENNEEFTFALRGNTIARPTVAVMLALDQSGSMDDPAGTTGAKRISVLREAAANFTEVIQPGNGMGIVRFDTDAYPVVGGPFPGLPITKIGNGGLFDAGRIQARNAVLGHATNLAGATSVGDGVQAARAELAATSGYDQKAIVVFTDGNENEPASIASIMGAIDARTYAIGLGNETQVNTAALNALTNGTGGYLLLTGLLTASTDDHFRLTKYFLQILAGVTNNNVVLDPSGFIAPGDKLRLPFVLTEADIDTTVILLQDSPAVEMVLETPDGEVIDPTTATLIGGTSSQSNSLTMYRLTLPAAIGAGAHGGIWHALLTVDESIFKKYLGRLDGEPGAVQRALAHGARYSLNVHAFSNIRMDARLDQNSLQPGATMTLSATLTEYGIPVDRRASVRAEVQRPDGSTAVTVASPPCLR